MKSDNRRYTSRARRRQQRRRRAMNIAAASACVLAVLVLVLLLIYSLQYAQISSNISTASQFNQNFKDEVDLEMYYFVTGSRDEIPWGEVETAEELATKLLGSTKNRESRRAANSVLNLCGNLKNSMSEIENTEGYDLRMHRLETNVYVITELVQEYMYTYLYHEAGEKGMICITAGKTRIIEIYNDLEAGHALDRRGIQIK